jgi:hypothetical protein
MLVVTLLPSWSVLSGNGRRATINLGIGHRLLVEDDMAIVGVNFFTDYETKSSHKRLSLGLEYQRANSRGLVVFFGGRLWVVLLVRLTKV